MGNKEERAGMTYPLVKSGNSYISIEAQCSAGSFALSPK